MDESQLETQLSAQSGPVSLNDVLLYGWVKHDDAMIYHIGVMNINVHKLFLFGNQVSRVLIHSDHSGPLRPERHQTIVASNFADWFWMIKSAWNQALPCWIIHDHPTSQIHRGRSHGGASLYPSSNGWQALVVPIGQLILVIFVDVKHGRPCHTMPLLHASDPFGTHLRKLVSSDFNLTGQPTSPPRSGLRMHNKA